MGRLIDADRLKAHYCWWAGGSKEMSIDEAKKTFDTIIDVQPTVEQPQTNATENVTERHGHWEIKRNPMMYQTQPYIHVCSECGTAFPYKMPYCGECGAKMDEVEE